MLLNGQYLGKQLVWAKYPGRTVSWTKCRSINCSPICVVVDEPVVRSVIFHKVLSCLTNHVDTVLFMYSARYHRWWTSWTVCFHKMLSLTNQLDSGDSTKCCRWRTDCIVWFHKMLSLTNRLYCVVPQNAVVDEVLGGSIVPHTAMSGSFSFSRHHVHEWKKRDLGWNQYHCNKRDCSSRKKEI